MLQPNLSKTAVARYLVGINPIHVAKRLSKPLRQSKCVIEKKTYVIIDVNRRVLKAAL